MKAKQSLFEVKIKSSFFFYILPWKQSVRHTDRHHHNYRRSVSKFIGQDFRTTVFAMSVLINAHAISVSDQSVSRPKLYRYSITRIGDISEALNRCYVWWSISRSTMTALLLRAMHLIRKDKKYCSVDQTLW